MDLEIRNEIDKLIKTKKGNGLLCTSTIIQLLNDMNKNYETEYDDAIQYLEENEISLDVDNSDKEPILDSNKIAIVSKTLSVGSIVKKINYEEINLDTEFQRKRSLWKNDIKSRLIESFMI